MIAFKTWTRFVGALLIIALPSSASAQDGTYTEKNMVYPDQGWSQQDRLRYYNTSQGSAAMSYDIFLALEQVNREAQFRDASNVRRYGLIPQSPDSVYNPDGLPIGITKTVVADGRWKGDWVGVTCAACHDAELKYKGTTIKVSGGNNKDVDFHALIHDLSQALLATVNDNAKFDRLAKNTGKTDEADKRDLRLRLEENAKAVQKYDEIIAATPSVVGPGRMDALRLIHNQAQSNWMDVPQNWVAPLAPAKPSFVWNIPQSAWAQWSGVLFDPLLRNGGESVGVFARMDLTSKTPEEGLFDSTIDFRGQIDIENLLRRLAPPKWPEEVLGKLDQTKVAAGSALFKENCAACHSTWPHRWSDPKKQDKRFIENAIVHTSVIGTDPGQFTSPQFEAQPTVKAGPMSAHLAAPFTNSTLAPPPQVFAALTQGLFDKALDRLGLSDEERIAAHGYRNFDRETLDPIPVLGGYKANPAEGMWSAPPYLHNGSVPSLYELLLPADQRSKSFFIGQEFDPKAIGIDTTGASGKFLYDTTLVGNSNAGHSFENGSGVGIIGRLLTDDERWALVEYMKSIPNEPQQISPFGGPKNPVEAWKDKTFYHVKNPGTYNGAPKPANYTTPVQKVGLTAPALGEESIDPDEAEFIKFIDQATIDRLKVQFPEGTQPVLRDAHPKTHALVKAEFIVPDDLPPALQHGVFKKPHTYDALIRFSAGGIKVQSDEIPQANGMAIKLIGVEGDKILPNEKDAKTQDFVMINNFPSFFVRNLKDYQSVHEALGNEDPTAGTAKFFLNHPEELAAVKAMRGAEPLKSPFNARYWSQTPIRLGPNAIKFSVRPLSAIPASKPHDGNDFLQLVARDQISQGDIYFEFLVQVQSDPVAMPVEDSLVVWDEAKAPFQRVAIIRVPKQEIDMKISQALAEKLSFNPWHSLPDHQPLGSINRARKAIYETISKFRHGRNDTQRTEPSTLPL